MEIKRITLSYKQACLEIVLDNNTVHSTSFNTIKALAKCSEDITWYELDGHNVCFSFANQTKVSLTITELIKS